MKSIVIHAWIVFKKNDKYFLPYTHFVYLKEIQKYYNKICLLCPVNDIEENTSKYVEIDITNLITIYELPSSDSYVSAMKHFKEYWKAYKFLSKIYPQIYTRYPTPFGWLQRFHFNGRRIIHFVGDPIDTLTNNPNMSTFKKWLYKIFFYPEHTLYIKACKGAEVFTNGHHLANKLKIRGITAQVLISSTLKDEDYYFKNKTLNSRPSFVYIGYLRKAKAVDTIIEAFTIIQKKYTESSLNIVGEGEMLKELQLLVQKNKLLNVSFLGHIDCRSELNSILRRNDFFLFGSLSEGSPRVILEAMANGLAVVSTPVGSLPFTFNHEEHLLFARYNDAEDFSKKIFILMNDEEKFNRIRLNAYERVLNFKIDNFIKQIFYEA